MPCPNPLHADNAARLREALTALCKRVSSDRSDAAKVGRFMGGLEGILVDLCGVPMDEAIAIVDGSVKA